MIVKKHDKLLIEMTAEKTRREMSEKQAREL